MNENTAGQVKSYVESVDRFLDEVESWIASSLKGIRQGIEISEEYSGTYEVDTFTLHDESGKKMAELIPVGTFVTGGNGRIDLNGTIDKAIIVKLEAGGPSVTTAITVGEQSETSKTFFYKGTDKPGWYWIDDKRRGEANFLDKALFFELLREVSGYELS